MRLKEYILISFLLVLGKSIPFTRVNSDGHDFTAFLFIQDVCGTNGALKDSAQSVIANYMALLDNINIIYLGTNNPEQSEVIDITSLRDLKTAMGRNNEEKKQCRTVSIGSTLDSFYKTLKQHQPNARSNDASHNSVGLKVNVIHVTSVGVDSNTGAHLSMLTSEFDFEMKFVGITEKNAIFKDVDSFKSFPGEFSQTYDPEVALLDLVNAFGSDTKPVLPNVKDIPRCIKNLQAAFAFHTDISSAQKVIQNVTNYFDTPTVNQIDQDEDTCEFNTAQLEGKTQFTGTLYANFSYIGVETYCNSNMDVYPSLIPTADFKQASQVNLQKVVDSYSHWYNNDMKMMCHCFDNHNPETTKIILWTPLSPTSSDTAPVSFHGFDVVNFKHIVMPFGFSYDDSPLWRSLVPDRSQWTRDASLSDYEVDDIIQDIWTITCRPVLNSESPN